MYADSHSAHTACPLNASTTTPSPLEHTLITLPLDAALDPPDALLACLTSSEDIEQNLSSFAAEMQTCASMLSQATDRSLVLIDELGRGTSHHEGFGIVYAIAEELIHRGVTTFAATHYHDLAAVLDAQPTVALKHLQVAIDRRGQSKSITYKHKVISGQAQK